MSVYEWLSQDLMTNIITTIVRPKLKYARSNMVPHKEKHVEIGKNTENSNEYDTKFEDLTCEERFKKCN